MSGANLFTVARRGNSDGGAQTIDKTPPHYPGPPPRAHTRPSVCLSACVFAYLLACSPHYNGELKKSRALAQTVSCGALVIAALLRLRRDPTHLMARPNLRLTASESGVALFALQTVLTDGLTFKLYTTSLHDERRRRRHVSVPVPVRGHLQSR